MFEGLEEIPKAKIHLDSLRARHKKNTKKENVSPPLFKEESQKGTVPNNNRPITYLSMMWKILTAQIRKETYYSLICRGIFPEEQKGYRKGTRRTGELLYMDQRILNERKTRQKFCRGVD